MSSYITEPREFNAILDGRTYNTSTAKMIKGMLLNTFNYEVLQLFKKKNGEYFIVSFEQMGERSDSVYAQNYEKQFFNNNLSKFSDLPDEVLADFEE